jgi:hypothetical protein
MIDNQILSMTEEEIDSAVVSIVSQFEDNERDFQLASQMYNSLYFRDVSPALRKRACLGLRDHFTNRTNNYWNTQAENQFL